jgi:hypothetical protein
MPPSQNCKRPGQRRATPKRNQAAQRASVFDYTMNNAVEINSAAARASGFDRCPPRKVPLYTTGECVSPNSYEFKNSNLGLDRIGNPYPQSYIWADNTWISNCSKMARRANMRCCNQANQLPSPITGSCINVDGPTYTNLKLEHRLRDQQTGSLTRSKFKSTSQGQHFFGGPDADWDAIPPVDDSTHWPPKTYLLYEDSPIKDASVRIAKASPLYRRKASQQVPEQYTPTPFQRAAPKPAPANNSDTTTPTPPPQQPPQPPQAARVPTPTFAPKTRRGPLPEGVESNPNIPLMSVAAEAADAAAAAVERVDNSNERGPLSNAQERLDAAVNAATSNNASVVDDNLNAAENILADLPDNVSPAANNAANALAAAIQAVDSAVAAVNAPVRTHEEILNSWFQNQTDDILEGMCEDMPSFVTPNEVPENQREFYSNIRNQPCVNKQGCNFEHFFPHRCIRADAQDNDPNAIWDFFVQTNTNEIGGIQPPFSKNRKTLNLQNVNVGTRSVFNPNHENGKRFLKDLAYLKNSGVGVQRCDKFPTRHNREGKIEPCVEAGCAFDGPGLCITPPQ